MLLEGLRLLISNWRLTLIQVLPAVWIWLALYDLKAHVLHGQSFHIVRGAVLIPINLAIIAITAGAFYLNATFAFAIVGGRPPRIAPAFAAARAHTVSILAWGATVGVLLGLCTTVITREGSPWFALSLSVVIGVMMVCYVAVPARIIGVEVTSASRRDRLAATALGGALGVTVSTPPYLLGRLGILMLGSPVLAIPGVVLLAVGFALQAGATGAVRAIKMSARLTAARPGVNTGSSPPSGDRTPRR